MDFNYLYDFDPLHEEEKLENIWDEIPVENIEPEPLDDINVDQFTFTQGVEETKETEFSQDATEDNYNSVFQEVEDIFQRESNANFHSNATTIPTDSSSNEIRFATHHPRERIVPSPNATTIPMERDLARPLRPSNEDLVMKNQVLLLQLQTLQGRA